jgi:hypothetical protein
MFIILFYKYNCFETAASVYVGQAVILLFVQTLNAKYFKYI